MQLLKGAIPASRSSMGVGLVAFRDPNGIRPLRAGPPP